MQRILVGGNSGAGKTTMARALAARLDLHHVEIDSLFHGPGWTRRPEFEDDVSAVVAGERWVIDHDYADARALVWPRLDTFVWLDYSRAVCEWRVVRRSVPRAVLRRELWNGNRERFFAMFTDPAHPVRWSWTHHGERREFFDAWVRRPDHDHVTVVRLATPRVARRWLTDVPGPDRSVSPGG
jgi:adenylate kinase family enzyme